MNIHKENDLNVIVASDDELELLKVALDFTVAHCLDGRYSNMNEMLTRIRNIE